jgi:gliding motility-associated lipoprotein GldH
MKRRHLLISVIIAAVFLQSCDSSRVFEENEEIPKSLWSAKQSLVFQTNIDDTVSAHNVYLNIRNAGVYPFSNIFLFINTTLPGGQLDRDTVEIMLATPDGKWLGKGLGDIWDNQVMFKQQVRFPGKGEYRFEIIQAMRLDPLPGIMDAGIRIEKAQ